MNSLDRILPAVPAFVEPPSSVLRGGRYGEDRLYLLIRDPRMALAVWEMTPALHARAKALAKDQGVPLRYRISIERRADARSPHASVATVDLPDALGGERWYVKLPMAGGECRALLGVLLAEGFEPLLESPWVPVPPGGPCAQEGAWDLTAEARDWLLTHARAARAAGGGATSAARHPDPVVPGTPPR